MANTAGSVTGEVLLAQWFGFGFPLGICFYIHS